MTAVLALVRTRPETTAEVTRGAARFLVELGYAPLLEVPLPNGRRADVMAIGPRGDLLIVEVKSSIEDYRADGKWPEYQPYCDGFAFAVDPDFPRHVLPDGAGVICADCHGGAMLTPWPVVPLAPARRKALTLTFARLAAFRAPTASPAG